MIENINKNEKRIITNEDLYELILNQNDTIVSNKNELHDMIVGSFDTFFNVMDENNKQLKSEITTELKQEISELRSDMNQRFLSIDKRLLKIEDNMVHKYEFDPLVKRVELLEAVL